MSTFSARRAIIVTAATVAARIEVQVDTKVSDAGRESPVYGSIRLPVADSDRLRRAMAESPDTDTDTLAIDTLAKVGSVTWSLPKGTGRLRVTFKPTMSGRHAACLAAFLGGRQRPASVPSAEYVAVLTAAGVPADELTVETAAAAATDSEPTPEPVPEPKSSRKPRKAKNATTAGVTEPVGETVPA